MLPPMFYILFRVFAAAPAIVAGAMFDDLAGERSPAPARTEAPRKA